VSTLEARLGLLCALSLSLSLSALVGCGQSPREKSRYALRVLTHRERGEKGPEPIAFVTVAATAAARQKGLGGRRGLGPDGGMLFVYPTEREREFWMKDCFIALDIAFLTKAGVIDTLETLPPGAGLQYNEIPRAHSRGKVLYVLEMESDWMARHGIAVGDLVDVSRAVEGVQPE